ncbi:hypothetical protein WJX81_005177 [Elliptochloris bilobata]|uniref:F-box domain-containing protein n=1 Tax=Elliptochloris bilobata TaxID=381761 RepID=A0AAW1RZJ5_9CHLO
MDLSELPVEMSLDISARLQPPLQALSLTQISRRWKNALMQPFWTEVDRHTLTQVWRALERDLGTDSGVRLWLQRQSAAVKEPDFNHDSPGVDDGRPLWKAPQISELLAALPGLTAIRGLKIVPPSTPASVRLASLLWPTWRYYRSAMLGGNLTVSDSSDINSNDGAASDESEWEEAE